MKKEEKIKSAREHNEIILAETKMILMEKERLAEIKKQQFDQKREQQF